MIAYILKSIFYAGVLLGAYFLLFEKEKMLRFKRFYLLASIILSIILPFITFYITASDTHIPTSNFFLEKEVFIANHNIDKPISSRPNYFTYFGFITYATIAFVFLFRFIKNLWFLYKRIRSNKKYFYNNAVLVLLEEPITPHSFLHFVFLERSAFENQEIEKEIIAHELAHVHQKHSLDILFLEFLQIFFWWNPFLWVYNKMIRLNHEFLADDAVIKKYDNKVSYCQILLSKGNQESKTAFSSQFHYSIIKKRFIMMTKTTSIAQAIWRQLCLLPLITLLIFLWNVKVIAQDVLPTPKEVPHTEAGVSQALLNEYHAIVNKYKQNNKLNWQYFKESISKADRDRLETIYIQMNKVQQNQQVVFFVPPPLPLPNVVPTSDQLNNWKDANTYGVWINNEKVNNDILNNYAPNDFSSVFITKLMKNAINYNKYVYEVNLMTKNFYEDYYKAVVSNKENLMVHVSKD